MAITRLKRGSNRIIGAYNLLPKGKRAKIVEESTVLELRLQKSLDRLEDIIGGRQRLLDALLVTGSPMAQKFAMLLGRKESKDSSLLDLCKRARTPPDELIKFFTEGALVHSTVQTLVKLADGVPKVMDAALESALVKGPAGFPDRKLVFEMAGIAKPEGAPFQINQTFNSQLSMGASGSFEKIVSRGGISLDKNPFDSSIIDAEEVENDGG